MHCVIRPSEPLLATDRYECLYLQRAIKTSLGGLVETVSSEQHWGGFSQLTCCQSAVKQVLGSPAPPQCCRSSPPSTPLNCGRRHPKVLTIHGLELRRPSRWWWSHSLSNSSHLLLGGQGEAEETREHSWHLRVIGQLNSTGPKIAFTISCYFTLRDGLLFLIDLPAWRNRE